MAANTTYDRPDLAALAYHYQDDQTQAYVCEKVLGFTPNVSVEQGSFRAVEEKAYYARPNMVMSEDGYPNAFQFKDTTVNFDLQPFGGSFDFSTVKLNQAAQLGYRNRQDMIRRNTEWLAYKARLDLEARFATFMTTSGNYASGWTYACTALPSGTGVQWNNLNDSDPLKDVLVIKEILYGAANTMIIGQQLAHQFMQHSKIVSSSVVSGKKRDRTVDPTVTSEYLSNVFGIPNVYIASGIYDSAPNEASMTKGWIWDSDNVFIGYINKQANVNPKISSFATTLVLDMPEFRRMAGWIAKETIDNRAGLIGKHFWDVGFWMQFKVRAQKQGFLLTNVMA